MSAAILSLLLASCSRPTSTVAPSLTISAAASLKDAIAEIQQLYTQQQPVTITNNFGASGSLQQQIEQGAPVDIFISAAATQMDALQQKGLIITDTRKNILSNQVVLIAPKNSNLVSNFKDLTSSRVQKIALGEPKSVPAGKYAQEVLTFYNIFTQIKLKIIYAKDVRQVLTYVETGNVDAGIVYITDAKVSDVKIVAIAPANSHSPVVYPVAVIKASKNINVAKKFVQFLSSKPASDVFNKYGFTKVTGALK
ncbi:MAG: molybdate ABC transporter substrate-binding protein [Gloeocapsa sp. UFS-A4-WI-NPMV-4B04]|nr:molybdate ABC transporter substrate-binding protein [Gloeocapsa sp. UFS-A4-WI-NPMV-4B04]